jgi:hypothetical protein
VLFHLLWRQDLHADLTRPLGADTIVTTAPLPATPSTTHSVNAASSEEAGP